MHQGCREKEDIAIRLLHHKCKMGSTAMYQLWVFKHKRVQADIMYILSHEIHRQVAVGIHKQGLTCIANLMITVSSAQFTFQHCRGS